VAVLRVANNPQRLAGHLCKGGHGYGLGVMLLMMFLLIQQLMLIKRGSTVGSTVALMFDIVCGKQKKLSFFFLQIFDQESA
jgi:hypothetical protein